MHIDVCGWCLCNFCVVAYLSRESSNKKGSPMWCNAKKKHKRTRNTYLTYSYSFVIINIMIYWRWLLLYIRYNIPHDFLSLVFSSRYFPTYNRMFSSSLSGNIEKKIRKSWGTRKLVMCSSCSPTLATHNTYAHICTTYAARHTYTTGTDPPPHTTPHTHITTTTRVPA